MIQTPNLSSVPASLNKHTAGQCAAVSFITQSNYGISFKKVSLKTGFCNCDLSLVNVCLSCLYLYILYSIQSTYWVNTLLCPCACGLFCELSFSARLYSLPVRQKACVHTHTCLLCVCAQFCSANSTGKVDKSTAVCTCVWYFYSLTKLLCFLKEIGLHPQYIVCIFVWLLSFFIYTFLSVCFYFCKNCLILHLRIKWLIKSLFIIARV